MGLVPNRATFSNNTTLSVYGIAANQSGEFLIALQSADSLART
jgi:hypothetical protein